MGVLLNYLLTNEFPSIHLYDGPERDIIIKATSINPDDRYQSAGEMKDALMALSSDKHQQNHRELNVK